MMLPEYVRNHVLVSFIIGLGAAMIAWKLGAMSEMILLSGTAGAWFYGAREVIQYKNGKRHRGGFDWPGLLGGVAGAGMAVIIVAVALELSSGL